VCCTFVLLVSFDSSFYKVLMMEIHEMLSEKDKPILVMLKHKFRFCNTMLNEPFKIVIDTYEDSIY